MKIFGIVVLCIVLVLLVTALVNYLLQRMRQQRAEKEGTVVYATVLSVGSGNRPASTEGGARAKLTRLLDFDKLGKSAGLVKLVLRVQEPGASASREITLRTRLAPGQKLSRGMKVAVTIDPQNAKRVYPAGPEAAKRVVLTGSRQERRQMKAQGFQRR